eukprot:TRINITY_DN7258_c0_g1_i1.p4 TRINITY_DN7258_c0_g1~~TRINITY_DN7258_c0_g1_i1.p4  ORF type:complete len:174 (+),score=39.50 TRINITY_DN7258_c0_g1_i1:765-1286(+)
MEAGVKIIFCGHSLGGAVAQLFSLAYAHRRRQGGSGDSVATVITFGCPRVGDTTLRDRLEEDHRHWRLFARDDPIAGVPSPDNLVLSASTSAQRYVEHASEDNWCLPADGCAESCCSTEPRVRLFVVKTVLNHEKHKVKTYAKRLVDHRALRPTENPGAAVAVTGAAQVPHAL